MSLPRFLVAALLALLVGGGLGAAMAAGDEPAPMALVVAEPFDGDRATYQISLTGPWENPLAASGYPAPEWRTPWQGLDLSWAQENVLDAEGRNRSTATLTVRHTVWDVDVGEDPPWRLKPDAKTSVYGFDWRHLVQEHGVDWSDDGDRVAVGDISVPTQPSKEHIVSVLDYVPLGDTCFFGPQLAGRTLTPGSHLDWEGWCVLPSFGPYYGRTPYGSLSPGHRLDVGDVEDIDGVAALRVDVPWSVHTAQAEAAVWYAPGIPWPVRLQVAWETDTGPRGVIVDLTGYTRGQDWSPSPASVRAAVPPLSPLHPWGIDTGQQDVRFPARLAYGYLHQESRVRDFLATEDSFVTGSVRNEVELYGMWMRSWTFGIENATHRILVEVRETVASGADTLPPPLRDPWAEVEVRLVDESAPVASPCGWGPDARPVSAAGLQAAVRRWHAQGGQGQANVWGYGLVCTAEGPDVLVLAGQAAVHHLWQERSADDPGAASLDAHADYITFDRSGHVHSHVTGRWRDRLDVMPAQLSDPPGSELSPPASSHAWLTPTQATTAGLVGALAGLLYWTWPWMKSGSVALFSRLGRSTLLDHPHRAAIHDIVMARPGIHFNEMRRALQLPNGTLRHHLQMLKRQDVLVERSHGRYTCYFIKGQTGRTEMAMASTIKSPGARAVLEVLQDRPGATAKEVARATGLSPGTVAYHTRRMQESGLLETWREGRIVRLQVA